MDKVDNFEDRVTNDFVPIKGVFNELFCRETSRSVKKSKRKKMQEGFYACNTAPYGYKKDPDVPGKLIIDKNVAKYVKKIFDLKIAGFTIKEIAEEFNKEKIETPVQYLKVKGLSNDRNQIWTVSTVSRILRNSVYTGDCIRGKTQNISYKTKKRVFIKRQDFIVTENTHEAIISKEVFDKVHNNNVFGITREENNIIKTKFADFMCCAYCQKKIQKRNQRGKINLHCSNNRISDELCKFKKNYIYEQIEPLILGEIEKTFDKYLQNNTIRDRLLKRYNTIKVKELSNELKDKEFEIKKITFAVSKLYNNRLSGEINEEEYRVQYTDLINKRKELESSKEELNLSLKNFEMKESEFKNKNDIIKNLMKKIRKGNFTSEDTKEIIKKIDIGTNFLVIHYNFSDMDDKKISCTY